MSEHKDPKKSLDKLWVNLEQRFDGQRRWQALLKKLSNTQKRHQKMATEEAVLASVIKSSILKANI
jgi:hypothetical protein